jgi:hypothetical protein
MTQRQLGYSTPSPRRRGPRTQRPIRRRSARTSPLTVVTRAKQTQSPNGQHSGKTLNEMNLQRERRGSDPEKTNPNKPNPGALSPPLLNSQLSDLSFPAPGRRAVIARAKQTQSGGSVPASSQLSTLRSQLRCPGAPPCHHSRQTNPISKSDRSP